jgi:hypothetical protein
MTTVEQVGNVDSFRLGGAELRRLGPESILALLYVALLPFPWPALPLNTRAVDLLMLPLAVLLLRGGHVQRTFRRLTPLDWSSGASPEGRISVAGASGETGGTGVHLGRPARPGAADRGIYAHARDFDTDAAPPAEPRHSLARGGALGALDLAVQDAQAFQADGAARRPDSLRALRAVSVPDVTH